MAGADRDPVTAVCTPTQNTTAASTANAAPAGCTTNARSSLPWAACENAVVIPHVGHGRPYAATHPHSGSPSCRCVP